MYISVNDAATKFNISKRRVQVLCEQGRVEGAAMIDGIWRIPNTSLKPVDKRKKTPTESQLSLFTNTAKELTIDDLCKVISISKATAKNWIRLGKITPDIGDQLFSQEYMDRLVVELKSDGNTKLKKRRNKKSATGKVLYKEYIHTLENQELVAELLELNVIRNKEDLLIVLSNFAIQLYFQSRKISFSNNNVLLGYLSNGNQDDFFALITDLLSNNVIDFASLNRLQSALSKKILFSMAEDALGFIYISFQDIGLRKSSGTYYTPENVVNELIDSLRYTDEHLVSKSICDPCCGTGNFLLKLSASGVDPKNLYGQDIDPISVFLTRINIALMETNITAKELRSHITVGNTYFHTFDKKFDVVLGNPPWGSELSDEEMLKCRELFKVAKGKSIESYNLFIEKSLSLLNLDGMLAFVLPEAILTVAAHQAVRKLMIESCSFRFVSYLGNVFSGVQCPSIILGVELSKDQTTKGCKVSTKNDNFIIMQEREFIDGTIPLNISDEGNECLSTISHVENAAYLKDNARFALGIVTGNNAEYISSQKKDGYEIVLKGSEIYRYGIAPSGNYIRFVPESFQQVAATELYRAAEKLLYRFICDVPVFAYDNQQTLSINSCNIVIPEIHGLNMKYVLAILNSSVTAYFISKKFNSVKLLRSHIEQIPIPVVSSEIQEDIAKKVDRIINSSENICGLYEKLDNDIMNLYGLSLQEKECIRFCISGGAFLVAKK